jgi:hypothetical protein
MSFEGLLQEFGLTLEIARPLYERIDDQVPFRGGERVETKLSPVDGIGIFARCDFGPGDVIVCMREGSMRTPAGRYTNHSDTPNAQVVHDEKDLVLVACSGIASGEEVLIDYRQAFGAAHE